MSKQSLQSTASPESIWAGEVQVSKITDMSLGWLRKKRISGGGIPYSKMGRAVKYRISDVFQYMEQRMVNSTSEQVVESKKGKVKCST